MRVEIVELEVWTRSAIEYCYPLERQLIHTPTGTILTLHSGLAAIAPSAIMAKPCFSGKKSVLSCEPPVGKGKSESA